MEINDPYVSIVSGTYNRLSSLKRMVESVRKSIGVGVSYEIVLVDGGSTDGTLEWIGAQSDTVLIPQGKLLGACKAFNAGFKQAKGKYVIIANDDIEFRFESILNAIAFMDDHLEVGVGCFHQNRHSQEYTCDQMPAVRAGVQVKSYYGQVCIIPRWLGDKVGWWGDYHTYGGDNELSCNVLELGFKVSPMEYCCINDFQINDELRKLNNLTNHYSGAHTDSKKWREKWTRSGLIGANVYPIPRVQTPLKRIPRLLYAPLYEDKVFPHQLKTKTGLRKSLSKHYLVSELNYRYDPEKLYYLTSMFVPDILLVQLHDPRTVSYDILNRIRLEFPNLVMVSWNGDYSEKMLYDTSYMFSLKLFDISAFVCGDVEETYLDNGINYQYWQIGYEEYEPFPDSRIEKNKYDILFLGNCTSTIRQKMGQMLRAHRDWKVGLYGSWPSHLHGNGNNQYKFDEGDALYRSSKISLGDCQFPKSIGYVSNRLFQALHAGSFFMQQRVPGITELLGLEDGVHLILWDDLIDLEIKLMEWLDPSKKDQRDRIAKAGKEFVDANHSFDARVAEFMQMIEEFKTKNNG